MEGEGGGIKWRVITSHVFLAFEHHKGIATVGLALLVTLLVRMGVFDDANLQVLSACARKDDE